MNACFRTEKYKPAWALFAQEQSQGVLGKSNQEIRNEATYLYMMKESEHGLIKVGRSKHPKQRLREIRNYNPIGKITLIFQVKTFRAVALETCLHRILKRRRVKGEWFRLDDEHIEIIKGIPEEPIPQGYLIYKYLRDNLEGRL